MLLKKIFLVQPYVIVVMIIFFFSLAEHDQLFYLVHEKVKVKSESLGPHLWTYRQKISLEHLGLTLKEEKLKKAYPILHEFLVEVS